MTRTLLTTAALVAVVCTAVADDTSKAKARMVLKGGYTVVSGERDGKALPAAEVRDTIVRITDDEFIVSANEKKIYVAKYKVLEGIKPTPVTFTSVAPKEGLTTYGLVERDGDTVKLIYNIPDGAKPTEFKTGKNQLMFVLKNQVAKDEPKKKGEKK